MVITLKDIFQKCKESEPFLSSRDQLSEMIQEFGTEFSELTEEELDLVAGGQAYQNVWKNIHKDRR